MSDEQMRHAVWTHEHRKGFSEYAAVCSTAINGTLVTDLDEVNCADCLKELEKRWPHFKARKKTDAK